MAIKISKVIADLNVGRQTIEEFLHKKGIEIDASINARIQDDVYEMLVKEFKPDMDLKSKSDKMANERQKEKANRDKAKTESREIKTVVPGQKPKILGKIELDAAGNPKPAAKTATEAKAPKSEEKPVEQPAEPVVKPAEETAPVVEPEKAPVAPKKEEAAAPAPEAPQAESAVKEDAPEAPVAKETEAVEPAEPVATAELAEQEEKEDNDEGLYKPVSQTVGGPQLKVVGKVDLTSLNQQTRPRKKSKEEKRNERLAKAQAEGAGKRKRKREPQIQIDPESGKKILRKPKVVNKFKVHQPVTDW